MTRGRWRCSASAGIVLEICPTSNLNTRVVSGWDEVRWIFDTFRRNGVRFIDQHGRPGDAPDLHPRRARDARAGSGILSVEEQEQVAGDRDGRVVRPERLRRAAHRSAARRTREVVEREEA